MKRNTILRNNGGQRNEARREISDSIVHWTTLRPTLERPLESCRGPVSRSETSPSRRSSPVYAQTPQGRGKVELLHQVKVAFRSPLG